MNILTDTADYQETAHEWARKIQSGKVKKKHIKMTEWGKDEVEDYRCFNVYGIQYPMMVRCCFSKDGEYIPDIKRQKQYALDLIAETANQHFKNRTELALRYQDSSLISKAYQSQKNQQKDLTAENDLGSGH